VRKIIAVIVTSKACRVFQFPLDGTTKKLDEPILTENPPSEDGGSALLTEKKLVVRMKVPVAMSCTTLHASKLNQAITGIEY
jgi:hypothetical protein